MVPLAVRSRAVLVSASGSPADCCSALFPIVGLRWRVSAPSLPVSAARPQPEPPAQLSRSWFTQHQIPLTKSTSAPLPCQMKITRMGRRVCSRGASQRSSRHGWHVDETKRKQNKRDETGNLSHADAWTVKGFAVTQRCNTGRDKTGTHGTPWVQTSDVFPKHFAHHPSQSSIDKNRYFTWSRVQGIPLYPLPAVETLWDVACHCIRYQLSWHSTKPRIQTELSMGLHGSCHVATRALHGTPWRLPGFHTRSVHTRSPWRYSTPTSLIRTSTTLPFTTYQNRPKLCWLEACREHLFFFVLFLFLTFICCSHHHHHHHRGDHLVISCLPFGFSVMIKLRVVCGGWRVGQVIPSWQNRQMSALALWWLSDLSLVSSLFSLLSSFSVREKLFLFLRKLAVPSQSLAGGTAFSLGNGPHSAIVWPSPGEKRVPPCGSHGGSPNSEGNYHIQKRHSAPKKTTHSRAARQYSLGQSVHCSVVSAPFFTFFLFFFLFLFFFFFWPSSAALIIIIVVTSWLSVAYHLVFSDDQAEGRLWWVGQVIPSLQNRQMSALALWWSLLSSFQFYKYLSLFSSFRSLAGRSQVALPGGSPNSLGNNEHSGKALNFLSFSFIFCHFLKFSCMFLHVLACSCMFLHGLACSCMFFHVLSCSFVFLQFFMFFHVLSFSFMFFHVLSFSFIFHFLPFSFIFFLFLSFSFIFFHFSFSFIFVQLLSIPSPTSSHCCFLLNSFFSFFSFF